MHRRTFVRLLAASPLVSAIQMRQDIPAFKVVSSFAPAKVPGMPGPYPGRVVSVKSDKSVDIATGKANDEVVREMMAHGMRALTGAATTPDAWRRFFEPQDVVGIKVNCGGYPHCISAYEIVAETVRQLMELACRCRRSSSTNASRTSSPNATTRRTCPTASKLSRPSGPIATSTTVAMTRTLTSRQTSSARRIRGRT